MKLQTTTLACLLCGTTISIHAFSTTSFSPSLPTTRTVTPLAQSAWDDSESDAAFSSEPVSVQKSMDNDLDITTAPTSTTSRKSAPTMSKALPFLACPPVLAECGDDMAGNNGFDPLGLAANREQLWEYREAEIKHARLAMLAAVGWPASELWDRAVAQQFALPAVLDETNRAPSLLNGGLGRVSPIWWGFCIGLSAAIDLYGVQKARRGDAGYRPGMLGFDPLSLYPPDREGQRRVEEAEIKHGRLVSVQNQSKVQNSTSCRTVDLTTVAFYLFIVIRPWSQWFPTAWKSGSPRWPLSTRRPSFLLQLQKLLNNSRKLPPCCKIRCNLHLKNAKIYTTRTKAQSKATTSVTMGFIHHKRQTKSSHHKRPCLAYLHMYGGRKTCHQGHEDNQLAYCMVHNCPSLIFCAACCFFHNCTNEMPTNSQPQTPAKDPTVHSSIRQTS